MNVIELIVYHQGLTKPGWSGRRFRPVDAGVTLLRLQGEKEVAPLICRNSLCRRLIPNKISVTIYYMILFALSATYIFVYDNT